MTVPRPIAIALFLLPWCLAITGIAWLLILRFPPSGTTTFDLPFDGRSAWIDPFLPSERVTPPGAQDGNWRGQRILGDPVYSSLRLPGIYDTVDLSVEFRPTRQPTLELGIMRGTDVASYEYTPIWFDALQSSDWRSVSTSGSHGYVRSNLPDSALMTADASTQLIWHASATMPLLTDPGRTPQTTRVSLRGAHDFWAVPADGRVSFSFEFQDSNRSRGSDAIVMRVFRGSEELRTDAIGVGGTREGAMGRVFVKEISLDHQPPGVYHIQLIMDDDVFIRSVTTPSTHWVVGPRLVFGDLVGYATSTPSAVAWSDSRHLILETFHTEGLQRIDFGRDSTTLVKTHEQIRFDRSDVGSAPQVLVAPKGDVRIIGDGWFAFTKDAFFSPAPRRVTDETDVVREGMTSVRTPYERPEAIGDGWYRAHVRLSLDPTVDHARIALSAPGISSRNGSVDIRRVTLVYQRPPLNFGEWWRTVRQELINAWRRLRGS